MWWLEKARGAARDGVSKEATVEVGAPSGPVRNIVVDMRGGSNAGDAAAAVVEDERIRNGGHCDLLRRVACGRTGGRSVDR